MKTNKIKFLPIIAMMPFLMACPKKKPNVPPVADTELQSSVDASFATFVISDIDMICSFIGEGDQQPRFYKPAPNADPLGMNVAVILSGDQISVAYNQLRCTDGRLRHGTVHLRPRNSTPNARYYHSYQFEADMALSDYTVDGWLIKTVSGVPCTVSNQLSSALYDPAKTRLSWSIEGSYSFEHPTDPAKNMTWNGKLVKTLVNSSDEGVFDAGRLVAIDWSKARVEYTGTVRGLTGGNIPFSYEINSFKPLERNFTCFPEKIGGLTRPSNQPWDLEFHPFIKGEVTFTTGDKYTRHIFYGNEDNSREAQCDNAGVVQIKGQSYKVDFMK